jgi:hypothetical protein
MNAEYIRAGALRRSATVLPNKSCKLCDEYADGTRTPSSNVAEGGVLVEVGSAVWFEKPLTDQGRFSR